jgi:hypothetical protein
MVEAQDAVGNRIAVQDVVEKPSVNFLAAESFLDGFDVWHKQINQELLPFRALLNPTALAERESFSAGELANHGHCHAANFHALRAAAFA